MRVVNYDVYEVCGEDNKHKVFSSQSKKECDKFISKRVKIVVRNMLNYGTLLGNDVRREMRKQTAHFSIFSLKVEKMINNMSGESPYYLSRP